MGTTTFFLRRNDYFARLSSLSKEEIEKFDKLSPYSNKSIGGWDVPMELHNGNIYPLVFWKGRLMKLEDAPKNLNKKYWDRYAGKYRNEYEWTLLKKFLISHIEYVDKEFKKSLRKKGSKEGNSVKI